MIARAFGAVLAFSTFRVAMFESLLATILALSPATAAHAAPLQPTSQWHVDFADDQCVASRNYGPEANPLFLVLKKPAIGDVLQLAVVQKGAQREPNQFDGDLAFDERHEIETSVLEYGAKKLGQRALMINVSAFDLEPMRTASSIHIRSRLKEVKKGEPRVVQAGQGTDLVFKVSHVPEVLKLLDECALDLRSVWNVWDENHDSVTLKKGPAVQLSGLFSARDYPLAALQKEQTGTSTLVMLIDETGKVADCTVTQTSGAASIDAQSCAVIRERGKFKPAIGLDGEPTKSAISQSITWQLE